MTDKIINGAQKARTLVGTASSLYGFGGLFGELLDEAYNQLYSGMILEVVDKYMEKGNGYKVLTERLNQFYGRIGKYYDSNTELRESAVKLCEGIFGTDMQFNLEFERWALDRMGCFEAEKITTGRRYFWETAGLSKMERRVCEGFNALDERVMVLYYGFGRDRELSLEEIAALPGFSCDIKYVAAVLDHIQETFEHSGMPLEAFMEGYDRACADCEGEDNGEQRQTS